MASVADRVKGPLVETRKMTALRIPPDQLEEIKRRAGEHRLTFTEYVIRCCLGELDPTTFETRLAKMEERLERLEHLADLGGLG